MKNMRMKSYNPNLCHRCLKNKTQLIHSAKLNTYFFLYFVSQVAIQNTRQHKSITLNPCLLSPFGQVHPPPVRPKRLRCRKTQPVYCGEGSLGGTGHQETGQPRRGSWSEENALATVWFVLTIIVDPLTKPTTTHKHGQWLENTLALVCLVELADDERQQSPSGQDPA